MGMLNGTYNMGKDSTMDFRVKTYESTPGIYFKFESQAYLYNLEWKLVTFVNITSLDTMYSLVTKHMQKTKLLCLQIQTVSNYTCLPDIELELRNLDRVKTLKDIIKQFTKVQNSRRKRGLINIIGSISKTLFGTLDQEDADYYQNKISDLEKEQLSTLKVAKEQMIVVKSTLQSVNNTLYDISNNENKLKEGYTQIKQFIEKEHLKVEGVLNTMQLEIVFNKYLIEMEGLLTQLHDHYEAVLTGVMHAQSGIIQVQLLSPSDLLKAYRKAQSTFPNGVNIPKYSDGMTAMIYRISRLKAFITPQMLVYVVYTPLIEDKVYQLYKPIPFPTGIKKENNKFVYIKSETEFLLIDKFKQTYAYLDADTVSSCLILDDETKICKMNFPIHTSVGDKQCLIALFSETDREPKDCNRRILSINRLTWLPIDNNKYIYVAPEAENVNILCKEIADVKLHGIGIIELFQPCTIYGVNTRLKSSGKINSTSNKDLVPTMWLDYDCCEHLDSHLKLGDIKELRDMPLHNVLQHKDELKWASHKVDDVEKLIREKEKELNERYQYNVINWYQIVTWLVSGIILMIGCCCCCRCCCPLCFKGFKKRCTDARDCCTQICIHQNFINKRNNFKTSEEDVTIFERPVVVRSRPDSPLSQAKSMEVRPCRSRQIMSPTVRDPIKRNSKGISKQHHNIQETDEDAV